MVRIGKAEAYRFLTEHSSFLLVGHVHPDGDDVGSLVALRNALRAMGKRADAVLGDPVPAYLSFIPSVKEIGTAIPADAAYDAMIFTDLANVERGGDFDFPKVPTLCIDHHGTNEGYADFLWLEAGYAAACEMVAELAFTYDLPLDEDALNALYMGIGTDSGFFKFSNTSAHTLLMASKLVERGAKPAFISNHLDVVTEASMEVSRRVIGTLSRGYDGKLAMAELDATSMEMDGDNSDYYADIPRKLEGVELAVLLKYETENRTRVSLRSREYANVAAMAAEFGGGGHVRAAGCTLSSSLSEARARLFAAAEKYL